MNLKHEKFEVIAVDYNDFDKFIKEIYQIDYEIIVDEELNNDSHKLFQIKKEELKEWDKEKLKKFLKSNGKDESWCAKLLLTDLCNQDLIEPGWYLIKVCW
jgi:hypothetical protein